MGQIWVWLPSRVLTEPGAVTMHHVVCSPLLPHPPQADIICYNITYPPGLCICALVFGSLICLCTVYVFMFLSWVDYYFVGNLQMNYSQLDLFLYNCCDLTVCLPLLCITMSLFSTTMHYLYVFLNPNKNTIIKKKKMTSKVLLAFGSKADYFPLL